MARPVLTARPPAPLIRPAPDSAESLYLWQGTGENGTSLVQLIRRVVDRWLEVTPRVLVRPVT